MLSLEKESVTTDHLHAESGATFTLKPLTAKRWSALRAKNTKADKVDSIGMARDVAVDVIQDWKEVDAECNDANKAKFGEKYAFAIMPELTDKAMELATGLEKEKEAAKKD